MKCILAGSFLLTLFVSIAPLQAQTPPMEKAAQVTTVNAERKPIAKTHDFVGRVEAINRVDVRARVKGYLDQVLFKEGDLVARFIGILTQVLTLIRPETSGKIRDIQLKVALGRNHVDFQAAMNGPHDGRALQYSGGAHSVCLVDDRCRVVKDSSDVVDPVDRPARQVRP